ncbi:MAG: DUF4129 domain-containing protein [Acidimicrobiales bacterium]
MARARAAAAAAAVLLVVAASAPAALALAGSAVPPDATAPANSVGAELPVPHGSPDRARATADEVLARREYRVPTPTLVERAQRWVGDLVDRVVGAAIGGGGASWIAWSVLVVAMGVVTALVARFARGITPDPGRPSAPAASPLRTATDWRLEAEAHERAGRWRPALRCRYRALVSELAAGGVVDEVPGRTAGEYRAAVGMAAPEVASDFAAVTEAFERAWYGSVPTSADDAAHVSSLADRVLAGTR